MRGFTLVEILIAFTIATLLLAVLMRSLAGGMSSSIRTEAYGTALLIAQSALEAAGSGGLAEGAAEERDAGRFRIATSVRRYGPELGGRYLVPYEVAVTVSWHEGPRPQEVALRSLRLGPPPP